ncbi:hypothetical protein PJE062_3006 [Pseudovibrio sp. JE062]|nr:hypothetical protein PJE062_3006 [Pseudovibrio sp. JE062]
MPATDQLVVVRALLPFAALQELSGVSIGYQRRGPQADIRAVPL